MSKSTREIIIKQLEADLKILELVSEKFSPCCKVLNADKDVVLSVVDARRKELEEFLCNLRLK